MTSCKIKLHYENPIDYKLLQLSDFINEFLYLTNHTPNTLTTYSFICGLLSCYFLYKKNITLFAVFYLISYFFDICDGNFARKYKMTSNFGDLYDHITDGAVLILLIIILLIKYKKAISAIDVVLISLFYIFSLVHLGCQQKNCKTCTGQETLDYLKCVCYDKKNIRITKLFGTGTFTIIFILVVYHIHRNNKE